MNRFVKIIENDEILNKIKPYLKEVQVYIIGGFIRDVIMEKHSVDRDLIILTEDIELFSKNLADELNAYFIVLDEENKIYRIMMPDKINYIDITEPIKGDINKDINRRDLTINAIAYDINHKSFYDPLNGIKDITNKKIKGISKENFIDDPLRLLRIFRFYSKTGFDCIKKSMSLQKSGLRRNYLRCLKVNTAMKHLLNWKKPIFWKNFCQFIPK